MYKKTKTWRPDKSETYAWLGIADDDNQIHYDGGPVFDEAVVPGVLIASKFSGMLADMEDHFDAHIILDGFGPLDFNAPVYIGDDVELSVMLIEQEDARVQHATLRVRVDGEEKATGEALIHLIDKE